MKLDDQNKGAVWVDYSNQTFTLTYLVVSKQTTVDFWKKVSHENRHKQQQNLNLI